MSEPIVPTSPSPTTAIECSICHQNGLLVAAACGHLFHTPCLLTWSNRQGSLRRPTTCPLCRYELVAAPSAASPRISSPPLDDDEPQERRPRISDHIIDQAINAILSYDTDTASHAFLISSILNGQVQHVRSLLQARPHLVNRPDSVGMCPLHHAVCKGRADMVACLISKGANVRLRARHGSTALHFACMVGARAIAARLIRNYACPDAEDDSYETPVFCALRNKDFEMVDLLVRKRANLNATNCRGDSVMHIVAQGSTPVIIQLMCNMSADMHAINYMGDTILHTAVNYANTEFVRQLKQVIPMHFRACVNHIGICPENVVAQYGTAAMKAAFAQWTAFAQQQRHHI